MRTRIFDVFKRYGNGTLALQNNGFTEGNTEQCYKLLPNLYLQLPTCRALSKSVTVCCEWNLNPQHLD